MATRHSDPATTENDRVHHMTAEEGMAMLDREAERLLGISGEEFIQRWESGQYDDQPETPAIIRLALMSEFTR